ncbi:hypothetical protein HEP81_06543 [Streptomyces griseofuscus]|uniref:Uncharacterized protein n=1 Tax=Streptomyces griseofuscus TaxID=146922 RepID=A0A7H1Q8Z8_9ACTN|nr:hypothetical protein [Streptomyces griseofuscus]QNT96778.1 hypothetical protein HEP81_06543 [Streptomyces griseofuscus]
MMCARCNKVIQPGEKTEKITNPGATAAGADIEIHAKLCRRAAQQTTPTPRWT